MDNKKKITIAVFVVAIIIAIAVIVFLPTKNTNTVYTISFNTNGGNEVVSQEVKEGEKITKPVDPSKEGYEFLGWYVNGAYFNFETEIEGNLTLEAKWKEVVVEDNQNEDKENEDKEDEVAKYTVTFDSKGGSSVSKQTVEEGNKAKEPKNPTRSGYTFKGWYLGSTKYNFSNKVTKNITLTAKWEKVEEEKPNQPETPSEPEKPVEPEITEYTVTFDANGGTSVAKQTIEEGKTASKPKDPTRTGYSFLGWYLGDTKFDFSTKITSNITLKADWKKNDVITWKSVKVEGSLYPQVRIYIVKNNEYVAGTADVVNVNGETIPGKSIPASGWVTFADTVETLKNIKVN